jgi:hypothetical protein
MQGKGNSREHWIANSAFIFFSTSLKWRCQQLHFLQTVTLWKLQQKEVGGEYPISLFDFILMAQYLPAASLYILDSSFVDSRSGFIFAQRNMFAMQGRVLYFTFPNFLRHRPTINLSNDSMHECERLERESLYKWAESPLVRQLSPSKSFLGQTTPKTERTDARTEREDQERVDTWEGSWRWQQWKLLGWWASCLVDLVWVSSISST